MFVKHSFYRTENVSVRESSYDKYVIMLNWLNHFYVESKLDVFLNNFTFVDFQTLTLYIITKLKGFISTKQFPVNVRFVLLSENTLVLQIQHCSILLMIILFFLFIITHLSYCLLYLEDKEENSFRLYNLLALCSV